VEELESVKYAEIENFIREDNTEGLISVLSKMPTIEVAEILSEMEDEKLLETLRLFDPEQQGNILSDLEWETQSNLFNLMGRKEFATIFSHMASDVRADFYRDLEKEQQIELLPFLTKKIREDVIHLSSYPPETAGGIMSTDFATIVGNMQIWQAIEKVRKDAPSKKMIYYVYVVDEQMKMLGFITLKDLIMAEPEALVEDALHDEFIYADVNEDREVVARKIEKYDLVALPVLNYNKQLLGIISHDDAIEVIRAEHTEDMEKFMGIVHDADGAEYLETSSIEHFKRRVVWIVTLAAVGIVSGMIIHRFESAIDKLLILALYMPMMADTGGNSGSQAATVVVRAMALGQVTVKNWLRIIFKEAKIAFLLAICLGLLAFGKIMFLSWETTIPMGFTLTQIALVISFALTLQVITATIIGAGLPLIVKRFGGDPAVAASPAITTVVDITGLLLYFSTAVTFLDI
jgi:magnesium transporter